MSSSVGHVDLVVHVGPAHTGGPMLAGALAELRPQLRRRNVAYVGPDDLDALPSVAGWAVNAQPDPGDTDRFAEDVRELVDRERRQAHAMSGDERVPVTLVSSQRMLGRQAIGTADARQFRPHAVAAIRQLIAALDVRRTRIVLCTRRQDRLMEQAYVAQVMEGRRHSFEEQFPRPAEPVLDFAELGDRIRGIRGVADLVVHPFEIVRIDPRAALDAFLGTVGLRGTLALDDAGPLDLGTSYSPLGVQIALAMNGHLDSVDEHALVREFVLSRFATSNVAGTRLLPRATRTAILDAYAEVNTRLFRTYLPDLPERAYRDNAGTKQLRRPQPH